MDLILCPGMVVRSFQVLGASCNCLFPELTCGSGSGAKSAEETELGNYQCLRVVVEDTVLVTAHSEMISAAKDLDKCDGGLAIDGIQLDGEPWLRQSQEAETDIRLARESNKRMRRPRSTEISTLSAGGNTKLKYR